MSAVVRSVSAVLGGAQFQPFGKISRFSWVSYKLGSRTVSKIAVNLREK